MPSSTATATASATWPIRRDASDLGLFGIIGGNAAIRNLGLVDNLTDYSGSSGDPKNAGGLVGWQRGGSITASYATGDVDGGSGNQDRIGVLVGAQSGGSITASYATGNAAGGGGTDDAVGALVGRQQGGSITASYATGNAAGGGGTDDSAGALVGRQSNGSITASYAMGNADGGDGTGDRVGALVGWQENGSITASYATGPADGGDGTSDSVGALVGRKSGGSITASYGFGPTTGEVDGDAGSTRPMGVGGPADLTAGNAGGSWNAAATPTLGAWDFGTDSQIPALKYADYDGGGATFDCNQFPAGVTCGTLLPRQAGLIAGGSSFSAVEPGSRATLSVTAAGRVRINSWSWRQFEGADVSLTGAASSEVTFTAPDNDSLVFEVTATDSDGNDYVTRITLRSVPAVDEDGNGLIDIDSLTKLNNMRHNLAGTSYMTDPTSPGNTWGCPQGVCTGYELTQDLDFDLDGDGSAWSIDGNGNYSLDAGDHQSPYFDVDASGAGGWKPIGTTGNNPFNAVFDGNGYSIRNLAIRRSDSDLGLFGIIGGNAAIRNLGLIDNLTDYTGSSNNPKAAGGLVGWQRNGSITASYATGNVDGGSGNNDRVGVLVGSQSGGSIVASYATGNADGRGGNDDSVGALVGRQENGSIAAAYATGNADGGGGTGDNVGALVGRQSNGSITASYATGNADGGGGTGDNVGALVGRQEAGSITASYATGPADGGGGTGNSAGALVGRKSGGSITASYGFGPTMADIAGDAGSTRPMGVGGPADLASGNAGGSWNASASNTRNAWDFGTSSQIPALKYADYDDSGTTFNCNQFPAGACGTLLPGQAGLIAGGSSFSVVEAGSQTMLSVTAAGRVTITFWLWQQLGGADVALTGTETSEVSFLAPANDNLLFEVTATDGDGNDYVTRISLGSALLADRDNNGLIDIDSLTRLDNMRHNLAGTSYRTSATSFRNTLGCPQGVCTGYELTQDLDFDTDGDGDGTWSVDNTGNYSLDAGDHQSPYFEVTNGAGGWQPIGDGNNPFTAVFDGNGYSIRNLGIRRGARDIGLFGVIGGSAAIRNIGLIDNLADYTGSSNQNNIGGLVGRQRNGSITASHATGPVAGGGLNSSIGGLVGTQDGSITASYATGPVTGRGNVNFVGGLVGNLVGSITASHATGNVNGGGGENSDFGGLVGLQFSGSSITASYASGNVSTGCSRNCSAGGLVGASSGSVAASYATGDVRDESGDGRALGGLVGEQLSGNSITASYATGDVSGRRGGGDNAGSLVGLQSPGTSIMASYAFGTATGGRQGLDGSPRPEGVGNASQLTVGNAGDAWNTAVARTPTLGAWDFGTASQVPLLKYADYDGPGTLFDCSQFPAGACGNLLPGQGGPVAALSPALLFGGEGALDGSFTEEDRIPIMSRSWRQLQGPTAVLRGADQRILNFTAPVVSEPLVLVFRLTAIAGDGYEYNELFTVTVVDSPADDDGDGLIDIDSPTELHNVRYNLAGTGYTGGALSLTNSFGCPDTGCFGYELTGDLDFDFDGDGSTWSDDGAGNYSLDAGDSRTPSFVVDAAGTGGWLPIGDENNPFTAVFDGNGHRIRNLGIRRAQPDIGLFGVIGEGAAVRNLGLVDNLADYTGSDDGDNYIGGLAGRQSDGSITASHATGPAAGGDGDNDHVGGLVGEQSSGSITASYARGPADGRDGDNDHVGGLVGVQSGGSITASYASGAADGGGGANDDAGGLAGSQSGGSITASYASGAADGGGGTGDFAGALLGRQSGGSITASYGFGAAAGETVSTQGAPSDGVTRAAQLTLVNAGSSWDAAASGTLGAWDFATDQLNPLLKYADYDGTGAVFDCSQFPADACGMLLPGQIPVNLDLALLELRLERDDAAPLTLVPEGGGGGFDAGVLAYSVNIPFEARLAFISAAPAAVDPILNGDLLQNLPEVRLFPIRPGTGAGELLGPDDSAQRPLPGGEDDFEFRVQVSIEPLEGSNDRVELATYMLELNRILPATVRLDVFLASDQGRATPITQLEPFGADEDERQLILVVRADAGSYAIGEVELSGSDQVELGTPEHTRTGDDFETRVLLRRAAPETNPGDIDFAVTLTATPERLLAAGAGAPTAELRGALLDNSPTQTELRATYRGQGQDQEDAAPAAAEIRVSDNGAATVILEVVRTGGGVRPVEQASFTLAVTPTPASEMRLADNRLEVEIAVAAAPVMLNIAASGVDLEHIENPLPLAFTLLFVEPTASLQPQAGAAPLFDYYSELGGARLLFAFVGEDNRLSLAAALDEDSTPLADSASILRALPLTLTTPAPAAGEDTVSLTADSSGVEPARDLLLEAAQPQANVAVEVSVAEADVDQRVGVAPLSFVAHLLRLEHEDRVAIEREPIILSFSLEDEMMDGAPRLNPDSSWTLGVANTIELAGTGYEVEEVVPGTRTTRVFDILTQFTATIEVNATETAQVGRYARERVTLVLDGEAVLSETRAEPLVLSADQLPPTPTLALFAPQMRTVTLEVSAAAERTYLPADAAHRDGAGITTRTLRLRRTGAAAGPALASRLLLTFEYSPATGPSGSFNRVVAIDGREPRTGGPDFRRRQRPRWRCSPLPRPLRGP